MMGDKRSDWPTLYALIFIWSVFILASLYFYYRGYEPLKRELVAILGGCGLLVVILTVVSYRRTVRTKTVQLPDQRADAVAPVPDQL